MISKSNQRGDTTELRKGAEETARKKAAQSSEDIKKLTSEEIRQMLHELRVHRIELEIQNEQLRQTQVELEASRTRYFTLYDLAPVGYCTLSDNGVILETNLTAVTMLGVPRSVLVNQPLSRFIHKEDQDSYYLHRKQLFETGEPQTCYLQMMKQDGASFWAHLQASMEQVSDGTPECRVVMINITERKEIESGLEKTRKELEVIKKSADEAYEFAESVINTVREPLISLDQDLRVVTVSRSFYEFFKVNPEETVGKLIYDLGNKQWDIPKLRELLETILPQQTTFDNYEVEHDFATIGRRIMLLNARQIERVMGKERIILLAIEDITVRKLAEAEIQGAMEYAENIVETVREPLLVLNSDLKILTANHSFYDTFKVRPEETIGNFIYDLGNRQWDIPKLRVLFEEILPHDTVFNGYQVEHDFLKIGRKNILLNARQIFRKNISSHIILLAMEDITERKLAETEKARLEVLNRQLQKAESLGRMAGAIAHHFNNQLHVVMGNLEMAMDGLSPGKNPVENLISAMQAARKASDVSSLMLTYLGQTPGKHEHIDLSEACRLSLPLIQAAAPKGTHLKADFPSLGPVIYANAGQIQHVLTNLVTNAWESADENRRGIGLTVKTVSPSDIPASMRFPIDWQPVDSAYVCLEVTDTGCGITEKDFEKIFDPFFSTKFTGRGLGLPVVLGIVRAHHGAVTVESEPDRGSIFRVFFPVSVEEVLRQPDKAVQTTETKEGGTVLLIEDEVQVRKMASTMLTRLGYTVLEAGDGIEAVDVFRQHLDEIHCVLTDLTMPRMDGWETLAALRKLSPDIPVILSSGYDEAQVMAGEHPERPNAFLGKPYRLQDLKDTIRHALADKKKASPGYEPL